MDYGVSVTEQLTFYKFVGAGNDFVLFDNWSRALSLTTQQIQQICDRRFGIGADGVILLEPHEVENFSMIYFNADGSRGEMCGNGARCIVQLATMLDRAPETGTFEADDGIHEYQKAGARVDVEIRVEGDLADWDVPVSGCGFINTGVPHLIMPVADVEEATLHSMGAALNVHPAHPHGTNLNVIHGTTTSIQIRTWERGVNAETLACGTGAVAAAIFAHQKWSRSWPIGLVFPGGELEVDHRGNQYWLKGSGELVFKGYLALSKLHRN